MAEVELRGVHFEYGLTTSYGVQTATQTVLGLGARPINVRLDGLEDGVTFHFRLVAQSANATKGLGDGRESCEFGHDPLRFSRREASGGSSIRCWPLSDGNSGKGSAQNTASLR